MFLTFQKVFDGIFSILFWAIAYVIRFNYVPNAQKDLELLFLKMTPLIVILTLSSFHHHQLYNSQRYSRRFKEILKVVRANTFAVFGIVIVLYFFGEERLSRLTILIYFIISTFGLIALRLSVRNVLRILRKKGKNLRHVLLVGNSDLLIEYINTAKFYKDSGIRIMGWIDSGGKSRDQNVREIKGGYDSINSKEKPDSIVLSYHGKDSSLATDFIQNNYNDIVPIQILPDLSYSLVGHQIEDFGGIPILTVNQPSFSGVELFSKRLFEVIGVSVGLVIISPLFLIIGIVVKLSSDGPIFYGQERIGLDGQIFKMWKFRTMKVASDNVDKTEWSNKENTRKTKIGEVLRKTSLDELPQLFNVLIGDMSLVGPRPERPFFVEKFRNEIPGYMLKHKMKPGITGWAQVNGWRGDTSIEKRIECDIYYIKHWSFWFDIKILFLTFWKGFINENAY